MTQAVRADGARGAAALALWLVVGTLVYNVVEAVVAIWAGVEAESVALLGFGLDSVIESAAAVVILWRLSTEARGAAASVIERRERAVHRFIGTTFLLLALYVVAQAATALLRREMPQESVIGVVLAIASLVIMPALAIAKIRVANRLGSAALRAEAKETLACSYLSFALLLGLVLNGWVGWWWADPAAALLMVPWLVKEGVEGIRGGCCEGE